MWVKNFIRRLFDHVFSNTECVASNYWTVVNGGSERKGNETAMALFEVLCRYSPGRIEENYGNPSILGIPAH